MATRRYRKMNKNKRKYSRKNKYFSKKSKNSKRSTSKKLKKSKKVKGGFGKRACPFITPPPAWNATGYSHFFPLSKNGVAPGGIPVFPGNTNFKKQNGGNILTQYTPQFMLNSSRVATNNVGNLVNRFKGKHLDPSPLPMYDQLKPRTLKRMGL